MRRVPNGSPNGTLSLPWSKSTSDLAVQRVYEEAKPRRHRK